MSNIQQDAGQILTELQQTAEGKSVVGLKKLETMSAIDSRTLRSQIEEGHLIAARNDRGFDINLEDAASFFAGSGATLWTSAAERRKKPTGYDIMFTSEELANELWALANPLHFKAQVRKHVVLVEASNLGRVRNAVARRGVEKHDLIKPRGQAGGYLYICTTLEPSEAEKMAAKALGVKPNYRPKNLAVHRLVASAFLPNPGGLMQVGHLDNNRRNNRATNLVWCTAKQNIQHGLKTGGVGRSDGRPGTKLTPELAKQIKYSGQSPSEVKRWLKEKHGIDYSLSKIHKLRRGEIWRSI